MRFPYLGAAAESDFAGNIQLIAVDLRTGKYKPWFLKLAYRVRLVDGGLGRPGDDAHDERRRPR